MSPDIQTTAVAAAGPAQAGVGAIRQLLTFSAGGQMFGVEIEAIKEIIQYGSVTRVPLTPEYLRGVLNLRGAVVPVVDLGLRFARPGAVLGKRACIVIIEVMQEGQTQDIGLLVDSVSEVLDVDAASIDPAPAFGAGMRADFIRCMARLASGFVIVLDVERVFGVDEMAQIAQAAQAEPPRH